MRAMLRVGASAHTQAPAQVCLGAAISLDALVELGACRTVVARFRFSRPLAMLCVGFIVAGATCQPTLYHFVG